MRLLSPDVAETDAAPLLDPAQAEVVATRRGSGPIVVLGGPGTGKTTVAVETVLARVERDGLDAGDVLMLTATRRSAASLRERVTARLGRTLREPLARTPHSYAFGILRRALVLDGDVPPRLISGPEQDRILADLLAGHEAGVGFAPTWPRGLDEQVRALRGFRDELRDLIMRAVERGLSPSDLARLGARHGRPDWVAASDVYAEYLDVTSLSSPGSFDPAGIVEAAAQLLADDHDLLTEERARRGLVVVDDAQELTTSAIRLVALLAGGGNDLVLIGDPDVATQGFRGARPRLLADATDRLRAADGAPARRIVLGTVHRQGAVLRAVTERVTGGITSAGLIAQRTAMARGHHPGRREAHLLASPAQEAAFVAQLLRRAHLEEGLTWGGMAVLVRSGSSHDVLRRAMVAAGVPVTIPGTELPVRDEAAVVPLRLALRCVLDPSAITTETAVLLLTGPIGGADSLALRRLRTQLRTDELSRGGGRASDELLVEMLGVEGSIDPPEGPALRLAEVLDAGRAAADQPGANAETVLWAIWQATRLGPLWQRLALSGGAAGMRADRDLDAVVALFEAAAAFVDRLPRSDAAAFLDYLEGQDLPADTLAERAPAEDSVTLCTATAAVGREWDLVVVTGVQEGSWPNLRLRSSLLGAQDLADLIDRGLSPVPRGQGAADRSMAAEAELTPDPDRDRPGDQSVAGDGRRRAVLDDELRLFLVAVSRARRRLVVTAVRSEDLLPSPLIDLVDPPGDPDPDPQGSDPEVRPITVVPRAMTLPALVAELRGVLLEPEPGGGDQQQSERRQRAAAALAILAREGVPGADPDDWYGLAPLSDDRPLRDPDQSVRVSPSKVEQFERCPLRWLMQSSGGTRPAGVSLGVGTMIHELAEAVPDGDLEQLKPMLDERFDRLGMRPGWVRDGERSRAETMLNAFADYVRQARAAGRELVGTEQPLHARVGRAEIRGSIDRLERDAEGRLFVVDLKTGRSKPSNTELETNAQLGTYQVGLAHAEDPQLRDSGCAGAALVQLGSGQKKVSVQHQDPLADAEDPQWAVDLVHRAAEGMAADAFPATVNSRCRTCEVRRACPAQLEGRQVGQ